jgi:hypothetical protein
MTYVPQHDITVTLRYCVTLRLSYVTLRLSKGELPQGWPRTNVTLRHSHVTLRLSKGELPQG